MAEIALSRPKVTLLTFGSGGYEETLERLRQQAIQFERFDRIIIATPNDLGDVFWKSHGAFIRNNSRGYGYWLWKSHVVNQTLESLAEGEILLYVDAGCSLNNGEKAKRRFEEYCQIVQNSPHGSLAFFPLRNDGKPHLEKTWTKSDVFAYFRQFWSKRQWEDTPQLIATTFLLRRCAHTLAMVREWYGLCQVQNYHLLDDSPSQTSGDPGFIDHRHDQSLFSILRKIRGTEILPDETFFYPNWQEQGIAFPIWATRLRR